MKHCVILALLGFAPLVLAIEIISANPPLPCTLSEHCTHYTDVPANATCQDGFCICQNATDAFNCSSAAVTHSDIKNTGTIQRPCTVDQDCTFSGGTCNRTIRQCECNTTFVLSSNKQKCLKKASNIGFPCTDDKQCLAFLPNTTCFSNECICVPGYHFSDDKCYQKVGFGENCSINGECSHMTGAKCMEKGVCGCPAETVINMDVKRCLPVAREIGEECVENKQCSMTFADSLCIDKKCECQDNYHYETELNRCFLSKGVGENCGNSYECYQAPDEGENVTGKALQCLSNTCDCAEDYYREGDKCVNAASLLIGTSLILFVPVFILQASVAWT